MAVTPVGNPYVESSDLVANYPGASEALAERLDVVGVNPFADSAARATAIPSPVEGQMASLNDDDKVYRYSGSEWVAVGLPPGLNPVAPTSIANSGGSASTTGRTVSYSGVTSISLNGVFSTGFDDYMILFDQMIGNTNPTEFTLRLRVGGADSSGANYFGALVFSTFAGTLGILSNSGGTSFIRFINATPTIKLGMNTLVQSPFLSEITSITHQGSRVETGGQIMGHHSAATSYDGFTILSTGPATLTGTIRVYGYAK